MSRQIPELGLVLLTHPTLGHILANRKERRFVHITPQEAVVLPQREIIRRTASNGFIAASYDITETCNFRCVHCYLRGVRERVHELDFAGKIKTIHEIEKTGAMWLQIAGGEPLAVPQFKEVYEATWDCGFIITVLTNGSLLWQKRITRLFAEKPPFVISVSLYGAGPETYREVTGNTNSWSMVARGINHAITMGLPVQIKPVVLKPNVHDHVGMMRLASRAYFAPKEVTNIIPTISGDVAPMDMACDTDAHQSRWSPCGAGTTTFHVNSDGNACLCKTSRVPSVPISELHKLASSSALQTPKECLACPRYDTCGVCPPVHHLMIKGKNPCPKR